MQEDIQQIEIRKLKRQRKTSVIVNNFYSLISIIIMSVVIIWYVNYILPKQNVIKQKELSLKNKYKIRDKQIKLSQKLHEKLKNDRK
jgi:Tfp pilus assembly protein PilO